MKILRRGHPFEGMELRIRERRWADGPLELRLERPDAGLSTPSATWTSLEARAERGPRTYGRAADYAALGSLLARLEHGCGGAEGARDAAGAGGTGRAAGALRGHAGLSTGPAGTTDRLVRSPDSRLVG